MLEGRLHTRKLMGSQHVVGLVDVHLTAAIEVEVADDARGGGVVLKSDGDVLVLDGDSGVSLTTRVSAESGARLENARKVSDAGELGRPGGFGGGCAGGNRHPSLGAGIVAATSLRDELVFGHHAGRWELGDEHALSVHVAAVLLDDEVVLVVGGGDPLETVDVLEGVLVRRRVAHHRLVVPIGALALTAEIDAVADLGLTLDDGVGGVDLRGEVGHSQGVEHVLHASEIVDAHVAGGGALDETVAAARIGRIVLGLRGLLIDAGASPELVRRGCAARGLILGRVLEVPRLVVIEVRDGAVPLPLRLREVAGDVVVGTIAEVALVPSVAIRGRLGNGEAIHAAACQTVPCEETGGVRRGAVCRVALHANVKARGDNVLGIHKVGAVVALVVGRLRLLTRQLLIFGSEVAVVAGEGEAHVVRVAAVHLDNLLEAAHAERADSVGSLGGHVDGVRAETDEAERLDAGGIETSPLLDSEEDVVLETDSRAPLLLLLEMRGTERVVRPEVVRDRVCGDVGGDVLAILVGVTEVHVVPRRVDGLTSTDEIALQVVGLLDELTRARHHRLGGIGVLHERAHSVAVVVDVRDV